MKFYNDGAVNFPYLSRRHVVPDAAPRWGLLKDDPDYLAVAKKVNQIDALQGGGGAGEGRRAEGRRCARRS